MNDDEFIDALNKEVSFNATESLKWRNLFQNERDHMNAATEKIERLKRELAEAKRKRDKHFAASKALKHDIARHVEFATELWEQLNAQKRSLKLADAAFDALEALAAAMKEALDDMGEDGYCVCPAAKIQAIAAIRSAE